MLFIYNFIILTTDYCVTMQFFSYNNVFIFLKRSNQIGGTGFWNLQCGRRCKKIGTPRCTIRPIFCPCSIIICLYRRDSSIYGPFGSAWKARQNGRRLLRERFSDDIKNVLTSKTKIAVAIVSNCLVGCAKIRLALMKLLLKRGLDLDTYGKCFENEIPRSDGRLHSSDIILPYKFYLSFENSFHCKDYITEKFFSNALSNFAVPVVWGAAREDYEAVAPPNSFIHVDDFKTADELIDHLNYLDGNDDAYLQYFR